MKIYNVPETSAVGQLINKLETVCAQKKIDTLALAGKRR